MGRPPVLKHSRFSVRFSDSITIGRARFSLYDSDYKWYNNGSFPDDYGAYEATMDILTRIEPTLEFIKANSEKLHFFGFRIFKNQDDHYYSRRNITEDQDKYLSQRHPKCYYPRHFEIFEKIMAIFPYDQYNELKKSRTKKSVTEKKDFNTLYNKYIDINKDDYKVELVRSGDWTFTNYGLKFDQFKIWNDQVFFIAKLFGFSDDIKTIVSRSVIENF